MQQCLLFTRKLKMSCKAAMELFYKNLSTEILFIGIKRENMLRTACRENSLRLMATTTV